MPISNRGLSEWRSRARNRRAGGAGQSSGKTASTGKWRKCFAAEKIVYAKAQRSSTTTSAGAGAARDCALLLDLPEHGSQLPEAGRDGRRRVAVAGRSRRRSAQSPQVRHAAAAVGGVHRAASGRLSLQPLLRTVSALAAYARRGAAPTLGLLRRRPRGRTSSGVALRRCLQALRPPLPLRRAPHGSTAIPASRSGSSSRQESPLDHHLPAGASTSRRL